MDFEPFFKEYRLLVEKVDDAFRRVQQEYGDCVLCKETCSDCCNALFDLTLIEAVYIKENFDRMFTGDRREQLIERANRADRDISRIKKVAVQALEKGKPEDEILEDMALKRVRCPALDENNLCAIYEVRPITCRLYGIPTEIGGRAHTCGISGFREGVAYPTVKLDAIYQRLYEISAALAQGIESRYSKLADMLVPLSMALLTDYTEDYLGVKSKDRSTEEK